MRRNEARTIREVHADPLSDEEGLQQTAALRIRSKTFSVAHPRLSRSATSRSVTLAGLYMTAFETLLAVSGAICSACLPRVVRNSSHFIVESIKTGSSLAVRHEWAEIPAIGIQTLFLNRLLGPARAR